MVDMGPPLPKTVLAAHGTKHCQRYLPGPLVLNEKVITLVLPAGAFGLTPSSGTKTPRSGMAKVWAAWVGSMEVMSLSCGLPLSSKKVTCMLPPSVPKTLPQNGFRSPLAPSSWSIWTWIVELAGTVHVVVGREPTPSGCGSFGRGHSSA